MKTLVVLAVACAAFSSVAIAEQMDPRGHGGGDHGGPGWGQNPGVFVDVPWSAINNGDNREYRRAVPTKLTAAMFATAASINGAFKSPATDNAWQAAAADAHPTSLNGYALICPAFSFRSRWRRAVREVVSPDCRTCG